MTQSEVEQAGKQGLITPEKAQPETTPQPSYDPGQPTLADFLPVLFALRAPLKHYSTAPTFVPKTFLDQIQFYDDGTNYRLYLYINKTWRYVALT